MTTLGLNPHSGSELRVGFRSGILRTFVLSLGGAGGLGLVLAAIQVAHDSPAEFFKLLQGWGAAWLIALVALYFAWDIGKGAVGQLSKLADGVKDSAVAVNRIADRDDRERDRMVTETAYVGQQLEKLLNESRADRAAQREHNERIEQLVREMKGQGGSR